MKTPITISGAGCCLVDQIYPDIDFSSPGISKYMSRTRGDGGLHPGRLVFSEQFDAFTGKELTKVIEEISSGRADPTFNVGGPSIVALIHASQLLQDSVAEISYHGLRGNDPAGDFLQSKLQQTPVKLDYLGTDSGATPSTIVLSDPGFNKGHGERIFINEIGAAWNFNPDRLNESFFDADMVVFGGTALVPALHDGLTGLLERSRSEGCITVVNTVYDFRSELENPGEPWPLGNSEESYRHMDLLIMDREEALHLSGKEDPAQAGTYFMDSGVSAYIITDGTDPTLCYSDGRLFKPSSNNSYPVSAGLISDLKGFRGGDTTGCGDNFVGGVLASMAWQLAGQNKKLDLEECISWGTVSGGYCCYHVGGTFIEMDPGEKLDLIRPYFERYKEQIHGRS